MKILAPSYKRAGGLLTHKIIPETTYCVHSFEVEEYQAAGVDVLELPDSTRGNIPRVRNWLIEWAKDQGEKEILLIDDDIMKLGQYFETEKASSLEGESALEAIEHGFQIADQWGTALWGINCVSDKGGYREYTPFACKSYCSSSFHGIRVDRIGSIRYDPRLPLKEDYDICLQVLNRDRKILRLNFMHMLKDDHGNLGGCACYRSIKMENEQMNLLIRKWGEKIVRRDKHSKEVCDINPIMRVPIGGV